MSVRKRAAGMAASPELDTPDAVKKRKKNEVSSLVAAGVLNGVGYSGSVDAQLARTSISEVREHHECSQWHMIESCAHQEMGRQKRSWLQKIGL
jgi:hypothetical protein